MAFVTYVPRAGNETILHTVVRDHLESLVAAVAAAGDGHVLPHFVEREFPDFLGCGYRLRYLLAFEHRLCRAVLRVYVRALLSFHRRRARRSGAHDGQGGAVTVIQRFGGGVNLHVHFHTLALDGVFAEDATGALRFVPLPAPTDAEVARLLATIRSRVGRALRRRGFEVEVESRWRTAIRFWRRRRATSARA